MMQFSRQFLMALLMTVHVRHLPCSSVIFSLCCCRYTEAVNGIGGAGLQKLFLLNGLQQAART